MKENNILHRDLKLENILIKYNEKKNMIIKITDYGCSKRLISLSKNCISNVGTLIYMAPEILEGEGKIEYNYKCDLWSIGIIIYKLYFGKSPFLAITEKALINNINEYNKGNILITKTGNEELDDLIKNLLQKEPSKRLNWDQYLNHPFFKNDFTKIINLKKDANEYSYIDVFFGDKFVENNKNNVKKVNVGSKLSDFIIKAKLREGDYATLYLVSSNLTKKLYAMKEIKFNSSEAEEQRLEFEKEVKILKHLHYPHVITYFTSFRENNNFYIVTEYVNGGSLEDLLKRNIQKNKLIDERKIWDLLIQSLSGLVYLHQKKKIIHRNIKPSDLLVDLDGNLKISNFRYSAIRSEEVEDLLKCNDSIAGPIQFMSPEMLGGYYEFKSDIYMLGLTFFFLMTNEMADKKLRLGPYIIPIKNPDPKLPESYSSFLRRFVQRLLEDPIERPSSRKALYEAIFYFSSLYLEVTSIISVIECFLSIPSIWNYFTSEKNQINIDYDKRNYERKYVIKKIFKEALFHAEPSNFNYELLKIDCLKLRIMVYGAKKRNNIEIHLFDFIPHFLISLHNSLNDELEFESKDINLEEHNNQENIDWTNEESVLNATVNRFLEKCRSKISDQFYYLTEIIHECPKCKKKIEFGNTINYACGMYPYRACLHLKKKELNIIDLFKHFNEKILFTDKINNCKACGKIRGGVIETKIFYTSPFDLILMLKYDDEDKNKFKLNIDELINIQKFVVRKDISPVKYRLVGAVFEEKKENEKRKYVSITKNEDGYWYYFNGKSIQKSSLNNLINHDKVQMLIYSAI